MIAFTVLIMSSIRDCGRTIFVSGGRQKGARRERNGNGNAQVECSGGALSEERRRWRGKELPL